MSQFHSVMVIEVFALMIGTGDVFDAVATFAVGDAAAGTTTASASAALATTPTDIPDRDDRRPWFPDLS
ncbi:MAG TPA: hypothetical protein VND23_07965 [Acidimicrobiales bacterium]|nr:hypothetical protein [Acidimicrobiales bacterium]